MASASVIFQLGPPALPCPLVRDQPLPEDERFGVHRVSRSAAMENKAMMEAGWERRRRKLAGLVSLHGRAAIAVESGLNPATLDQVLKGVLLPAKADGTRSPRKLGDEAARRIEAALKLPRGWFDAEDDFAFSDAAMELARCFDRMSGAEQERLKRVLEAIREPEGGTNSEADPR